VIDEEINFTSRKDEYNLLRYFQKHILERCYKVWPDNVQHFFKKAYVAEHNTYRHFKIEIDSRFTEVHINGELPEYRHEWHELLYLNEDEYFENRHQFPFASFRMEGFLMLHVQDVSKQAAFNKLNNAIVKNIPHISVNDSIAKVQLAMGELLNDVNIQLSVTPFFNINGQMLVDEAFDEGALIVSVKENCPEHLMGPHDIRELFSKSMQPYIYSKADAHLRKARKFWKGLEAKNINSYMAYPLHARDGLIGILEIGSENPLTITEATIIHLQLALPILNDVAYLMMQGFNSMIDQLVKQEFTSLQPSVEWKFKKVVFDHISATEPDTRDSRPIGNIEFNNVHPLYGAIDIKNSSVERNKVCVLDYQHQLKTAIELLRIVGENISLQLLEGTAFKCNSFLASISENMTAENELKVNEFFQAELDPLLQYLVQTYLDVAEPVKHYIDNCANKEDSFHTNRNLFEKSVRSINNSIIAFLEVEIHKLQKTFPFYFEKYRTDGVEYNIYIGPSLVPNQPYNPLHLKNVRLWQITSMAEVARLTEKLKGSLAIRLETTQIILVYSHPIDISFRKDERRFDVEGSYNIKYEVMKKRIDKVRIKGTMERLTKAGTVAIVFNNQKDIDEYKEHIAFLQAKGLLTTAVENLELEELQGISGLRAIRLGVCY
jgi:hypothetical protein